MAGSNCTLLIITQPYSEVYWGYFGRLVFGNSLTKHNKISSFSYSVVIVFLPLSHIPPCYHANPPNFPRLIGPRAYTPGHTLFSSISYNASNFLIINITHEVSVCEM